MSGPLDDTTLLDRLRGGDRDAYAEIFKRYWFSLYRQAVRKTRSREDAEEIVQNLFLELWQRRESIFAIDIERYLRSSLYYKCVDYIRKKIRTDRDSRFYENYMQWQARTYDEHNTISDLKEMISLSLASLPDKSQDVFRLHKLEGLTNKEVATKLALSEKAVEYHLTKALRIVRLYLKEFVLLLLLFA